MTADLLVEGDFLTPFGLCVEKLESEFFRLSGMSRGWVLPASNLLILTGMYNAGKAAEAKMIARRYGDIRFCFAETGLLLVKGENGLSHALEADLDLHRIFRKREGQSWEGSHGTCCCLVYTPVAGKLELTAPRTGASFGPSRCCSSAR